MEIKVEVPDGEYCDGCIFKQHPVSHKTTCLLLHNKRLYSDPTTIIRDGRNIWVEHAIKDKDCPVLKEQE